MSLLSKHDNIFWNDLKLFVVYRPVQVDTNSKISHILKIQRAHVSDQSGQDGFPTLTVTRLNGCPDLRTRVYNEYIPDSCLKNEVASEATSYFKHKSGTTLKENNNVQLGVQRDKVIKPATEETSPVKTLCDFYHNKIVFLIQFE
jgi:hypothetical protein